MWKSRAFGEISKGLVERVGNLLLVFHAFHRPVISSALFMFPFSCYRRAGSRSSLSLHRLTRGGIIAGWAINVQLQVA